MTKASVVMTFMLVDSKPNWRKWLGGLGATATVVALLLADVNSALLRRSKKRDTPPAAWMHRNGDAQGRVNLM